MIDINKYKRLLNEHTEWEAIELQPGDIHWPHPLSPGMMRRYMPHVVRGGARPEEDLEALEQPMEEPEDEVDADSLTQMLQDPAFFHRVVRLIKKDPAASHMAQELGQAEE